MEIVTYGGMTIEVAKNGSYRSLAEIVFNRSTTDNFQQKFVKYITMAITVIWDSRTKKVKGEKEPNITEEFTTKSKRQDPI